MNIYRGWFCRLDDVDHCLSSVCPSWNTTQIGGTALIWAALKGHIKAVNALLSEDASIEAVDLVIQECRF